MVLESAGSSSSGQACNIGVTDNGKSLIGSIMDAAAVAVAVLNTKTAIEMAELQYGIAKQYLDIAKWYRNYYNNTYKPLEDQELEEAWALEPFDAMYDITIGRTRNHARLQFAGVAEKSIQCTSAYCTGLRQALIKDTLNAEAASLAALSNMGYRNERAYKAARDSRRWERRLQVLNRGRGLIANNIQFSSLAAGIYGDIGQQAGAAAGGAIRYLGYSWNRNETQFPTLMRGVGQEVEPTVITASGTVTQPTAVSNPVTSGYYYDETTNSYVQASGSTYQQR